MTPEEFEPIAVWMGWRLAPDVLIDGERVPWWVNTKGALTGPGGKTSLTPAEC